MPAASDLDVYVEHAERFAGAQQFILRRALDALRPAGLAYRVLDRAKAGRRGRVAFVHVDLTVVPPRHRPADGAYGVAICGGATDISRTRYTTAALARESPWAGPVIVKSVLNHRGMPELAYRRRTDSLFRWKCRFERRLGRDVRRRACPAYALFPSLAGVPAEVWDDSRRIVERFLPGSLTTPVVKHRYDFFLDIGLHTRSVFDSLLCDPAKVREVSVVEGVPAEVERVRNELQLDFGSIDYFMVDGEAVVVDANKTTTCTESWVRDFPPLSRFIHEVGARLIEVVRSGALGKARAAGTLVRSEVLLEERLEATLVHRGRRVDLEDLRNRRGLLAISIKNPAFTNELVAAFGRLCRSLFAGGIVTIVDRPYHRNVSAAGRGPDWEAAERRKLARIAEETRARAARLLAHHAGPAVSLVAWDELAASTPDWIGREIRAGFARRGRFYADVLSQTRSAIPSVGDEAGLERYAEFVLEELPVLLHLYYFGDAEIADVYPGPQPQVFWRLEAGAYGDEMPELTRRLHPRSGLIYVHARELRSD